MANLKERLAAVASVLDLGGEGCTVCGALDKAPYTKEVTYTARTVEKTFKSTSWPEVAAWLKEHAPGQVSIQDVLLRRPVPLLFVREPEARRGHR